jgi:hypothetical protein
VLLLIANFYVQDKIQISQEFLNQVIAYLTSDTDPVANRSKQETLLSIIKKVPLPGSEQASKSKLSVSLDREKLLVIADGLQ